MPVGEAGGTSFTSTSTPSRRIGWQSGISNGVFFAAIIPAMRATESASPFLRVAVEIS